MTTVRTACPSVTVAPAAGDWPTTIQLASTTCLRPFPDASFDREKKTPARWIVFCASCRFKHTTAGIRAGAVGTLVVGAAAAAVAVDGVVKGEVVVVLCVVTAGTGAWVVVVATVVGDGDPLVLPHPVSAAAAAARTRARARGAEFFTREQCIRTLFAASRIYRSHRLWGIRWLAVSAVTL